MCRSQWPHGTRRRSTAARLLRLWVRIPWAWMFVCFVCHVLSGRGLCDGLITRPEESYRLWCVIECDLETSWMKRPWPTGGGLLRQIKKKNLSVVVSKCHFTLHTLTEWTVCIFGLFAQYTKHLCWPPTIHWAMFLNDGTFTKLWEETTGFIRSVCPSARKKLGLCSTDFWKFYIWIFFKNLSLKFKFH